MTFIKGSTNYKRQNWKLKSEWGSNGHFSAIKELLMNLNTTSLISYVSHRFTWKLSGSFK